MSTKKVMLLFGGESSEHEVSIASARNVYPRIDKSLYSVHLVFIDKSGTWWLLENFNDHANTNRASRLMIDLGTSRLTTRAGLSIDPDILFPILHGKNGEDGSIQGLAQLLHMRIVGCDMTPSVLAMDKIAAKEILAYHGFTVLPFISHRSGDTDLSYDALVTQLGTTLFVKPSRAGSSVGVSKVTNKAEFIEAMKLAHEHDEFVLIEKAAIKPRELEVAVLGRPPHHEASGVGEILPDGEFYSYDSKYASSSQSKVVIPAEIDDVLTEQIRNDALRAYAALKCRGFARVDFLLDGSGLYINEINTIPGFTDISMYPKLWEANGLEYGVLVNTLIEQAG